MSFLEGVVNFRYYGNLGSKFSKSRTGFKSRTGCVVVNSNFLYGTSKSFESLREMPFEIFLIKLEKLGTLVLS